MPRRTALIVVVPEAQEHVFIAHVPAHVTILFPFAPPEDVDEPALRELFAALAPFDFRLDRVESFADGTIVWLHPEPSAPFAELTRAVVARWPEFPPYEGAHEEVIPHLTVSETPREVNVPLPLRSRASEVTLIEEDDDGRWSNRAAFPLAQGVE
jgi:2'-5' RNA ligase